MSSALSNSENLLEPDDRYITQLVKMSIDSKFVELTPDVFRLLLYILCFFGRFGQYFLSSVHVAQYWTYRSGHARHESSKYEKMWERKNKLLDRMLPINLGSRPIVKPLHVAKRSARGDGRVEAFGDETRDKNTQG